jgi:hypothetical protein
MSTGTSPSNGGCSVRIANVIARSSAESLDGGAGSLVCQRYRWARTPFAAYFSIFVVAGCTSVAPALAYVTIVDGRCIVVVAWKMSDAPTALILLRQASRREAHSGHLLPLTVAFDMVAHLVGIVLAAFLFMRRRSVHPGHDVSDAPSLFRTGTWGRRSEIAGDVLRGCEAVLTLVLEERPTAQRHLYADGGDVARPRSVGALERFAEECGPAESACSWPTCSRNWPRRGRQASGGASAIESFRRWMPRWRHYEPDRNLTASRSGAPCLARRQLTK